MNARKMFIAFLLGAFAIAPVAMNAKCGNKSKAECSKEAKAECSKEAMKEDGMSCCKKKYSSKEAKADKSTASSDIKTAAPKQ